MSSTINTWRSVRSRSRSFMMRTTPLVRVADPYDDTAMKSNSTGRSIGPGEIGHEHERTLEDADEQWRVVVVVGRDLLAEIADALLQFVFVDDDPTDVRVVHAGNALWSFMRRLRSARGSAGCRGDPDTMIDTVTDDPHGFRSRNHRRRRPRGVGRATPASASASCSSFEPLRPEGPEPFAGLGPPHHHRSRDDDRRRRPPGSRPSGHATGRTVLDPGLDLDVGESRPARQLERHRYAPGCDAPGPTRARGDRRPARSDRRPGSRRRARRRARPRAHVRRSPEGGTASPRANGGRPADASAGGNAATAAASSALHARPPACRGARRRRGAASAWRASTSIEIAIRAALELRNDLAAQPHAPMVQLVVHRVVHGREPEPGAQLVGLRAANPRKGRTM